MLRALAAVGLIWDLHGVPDHVRDAAAEAAEREPELDLERPAPVA